jgi:tight adherence protein B
VSVAPLLAAGAAVAGLMAAWSALGAAEHGVASLVAAVGPDGALGRALKPLRAGREASTAERRRLMTLGALALLATGWLFAGPLAGFVLAAGGPFAAAKVLAASRRRRAERLAAGAPAVARAIADALAGGHSIRGALAAAAGSVDGPARDELQAVAAALALGERTDAAIETWRARAGHSAYDAIAAAIMLQRDAGGDLAALLRSLAAALDEHVRAEADARSLTAQARFTALIVAVLPLIAAALAELGHPGYLASLVSKPLSALLIALSVILQAAAAVAIRRIARLRA